MRFFTLLFAFVSVAAFGQKKVLVQSIRIDNNYAEVAANPFDKPEHEAVFLQLLEQNLQEQLGPVTVDYLAGPKKILLADKAIAAKDPGAIIDDYKELYRAKKGVDRQAYDLRLDIAVELADVFIGKKDNVQVMATVVARDAANRKVFKRKGKVNVNIQPIPFALDQLNEQSTTVYESFPLSERRLVEALGQSVGQALAQSETVPELAVERQPYDGYSEFMTHAVSYRVLARNDYGNYLTKTNLFRLLTFAKHKPIVVMRQEDKQGILLGLRDRRVTDIGYQLGLPPVYEVGKLHKNYLLYSQFSPDKQENYFLHTVQTDKRVLKAISWSEPLKLNLKAEHRGRIGEFTFSVKTDSDVPVQETQQMHRVYHPWAQLEGVLEGKPFAMRTNPYLLNVVEIKWGDELTGLVVHAAAPKQYLRKRKNALPYYVYFHPMCSEAQQQLLLQTFQTFHLAKVLHNSQRQRTSTLQ